MKNGTNQCNVNKIKEPKTAKECLFDDLVTLLIFMNVNFTSMSMTLGKNLVNSFYDSLWHITCNHDYFADRCCPISDLFSQFKNLNNYQAKQQAKSRLFCEIMKGFVDKLSGYTTQPWLTRSEFASFHVALVKFIDCLKKLRDRW